MKNKINDIIFTNNKLNVNRIRGGYFKKYHPVLYNQINDTISDDYSFKEKIYIIYYSIEPPICENCSKKTNLISFSKGFRRFCSKKCTSIATRDKVKQTNLEKYGTEFPLQNQNILKKLRQTNLEKYGTEYVLQNQGIKTKIKQTNLEKYGVDNPFKSEEIKTKIKQTNLEKYGVKHNSCSKEVVNKRKKTFIEKYGVDNPNKSEIIIEKRNNTIINNYIKKYSKILNIDEKNITSSPNDIVTIKNYCDKHKSFRISKQNLFNRLRYGIEELCTKCNPISNNPRIKENEIKNWIKNELNINFIENDRKILKGKELDIYIPEHQLAIEFNGLYYHSNKHTDKKYHFNKTEGCEEKNIQLLHIFEDEWINKKDIVKSIIRSKLGLLENRIFARKCEIKEINNNKLIRNFLCNNHLQGFVGGKIKLGLFYNNELVSIIIFGMKRRSLGSNSSLDNEYELLRFCNKLNTNVIGGASRLFKYFIKNYKPNSILTYADRRYSDGNLYKKIGFNYISKTQPNYWYFKKTDLIRYHRFKFRKDVLVKDGYNPDKTEKEIMLDRGYYFIYDSGNLKFNYNPTYL